MKKIFFILFILPIFCIAQQTSYIQPLFFIDDLKNSEEQTTTITAFTTINGLAQTFQAGLIYEIELQIVYNTAVTTTGINLSFGGGTPTIYSVLFNVPSSTGAMVIKHFATPLTETTNTTTARLNNNFAWAKIIFSPNITGTYAPAFATEVAGSAITIKRGSTLKYRIINN